MRRCSGWRIGIALFIMAMTASCGGTGGGPVDSGQPLVFALRGRLNLIAQTTSDPRQLLLIATLLDPQGLPFRDSQIAFTAEFPDVTMIPGDGSQGPLSTTNGNRGTALTDTNGRAEITLTAGRLTGPMRVTAEGPPELNLSSGITVQLTEPGFVNLGPLGILPIAVSFVNPAVSPSSPTLTIFEALGGRPPYTWRNGNVSLASLTPTGPAGVDSLTEYRLLDPLPTGENGASLTDVVTLTDDERNQATADVQVIFSQCLLTISPTTLTFGSAQSPALGGEQAQITVTNAVPPLTVTSIFPDSGTISTDQDAGIVTFTVATPAIAVSPDTLVIRDSRGCRATAEITVVPAPAPQVTTITLERNPLSLNGVSGGLSIVTAHVFDQNNQPLEGIEVLFTTTIGLLNSPTATTDADGQAVVTVIVPQDTLPGTATVRASSRGIAATADIAIVDPRTLVTTIILESDRPNLNGLTGETGIVGVSALDANNLPVEGVTILLSTTQGTLSETLGTTDPDGQFFVSIIIPPGTPAGSVTVTGTAQGASGNVTIPIIDPSSPLTTLILTATPPVVDRVTGGTSVITATALDGNNLPIVGIDVLFTSTDGAVDFLTATTGGDGQASVTLSIAAGTLPGSVAVTGSAQNIAGSTNITVIDSTSQLTTIVLTAVPAQIDGIVGGASLITATAFDVNNLPLEGVEVLFSTTQGFLSSLTAMTGVTGEASVTLTISADTPVGTATVTGSLQNVSGSVDVTILDTTVVIQPTIILTASPAIIDGTLGGTAAIRAFVFDQNNLPVEGVVVLFTSTGGVIAPITATTNATGEALATLTVPAGTPDGTITMVGAALGVSGSTSVTLQAGFGGGGGGLTPATIVLTADPATLDGALGGASAIRAFVFDENNLPVAGTVVLFTTTGGIIAPITATTSATGEALVTLTIPTETPDGTVTITGSAMGISGSVNVTLQAGFGGGGGSLSPASIACVSAAPTTIGVRGSGLPEQSAVTFTVTTTDGIVVPGTDIHFFVTSLGGESISPVIGRTNTDGQVIANLTSGTRANDVSVTAAVDVNADGIFDVTSQCTLVTIVGAPPVQGRLNLVRAFANIAGRVTSGIPDATTATMNDRFGNPVPINTAVSFTTNGGSIIGQGIAEAEGEALATLESEQPVPSGGLVVAMAHTLGQEPFIDNNGNGIFDPGTDVITNDSVPEPFIDRNGNCAFDPGDPNEVFIDVNGNGVHDLVQGTPGVFDTQIFVWDTVPVMFSGGTILSVTCISGCAGGGFSVPNGGSSTIEILARDADGNPLTSATTIAITVTGGGEATPTSFSVPDTTNCGAVACGSDTVPDPASFPAASCGGTVTGVNRFLVTVQDTDAADTDPAESSTLEIALTSDPSLTAPGGNVSFRTTISGSVD